jgi:glycosyltransferase involved in cell wall biosynthesis
MGGSATRAYNLAKGLMANGVKVTLVAGVPHYPTGDIPEGYRWKAFVKENIDGFTVIRTFIPPLASIGFARRFFLFASFIFSSLFALLFVGRVDGVFASYPQILSFFPAYVYGLVLRCPVVLNVDDLWPESLYDLGMLKWKPFRNVAEFVATVAYSVADAITPISPSYIEPIVNKYGVEESKVVVVPGGVDLSYYSDVIERSNESVFKVLYIGAFSPAYDFEQVLMAAKLLEEEDDVRFVLQGGGEMAPVIRRRIKELGLKNVELIEKIISRSDVARLLMNSDVLLLPLSGLENVEKGISSKLYEYQAAGKPIICCSSGMPGCYVSETNSGIVVEPGDYKSLANAVLFLKQNNDVAANLGASGRNYVENNVSIESIGLVMKNLYFSIQ